MAVCAVGLFSVAMMAPIVLTVPIALLLGFSFGEAMRLDQQAFSYWYCWFPAMAVLWCFIYRAESRKYRASDFLSRLLSLDR